MLHQLLLGATVVVVPEVGAPWAIAAAAVANRDQPPSPSSAGRRALLILITVGLVVWWWGVGGRAPTSPVAWSNLLLGTTALAAAAVARPAKPGPPLATASRSVVLGLGVTLGVAIEAVVSLPALWAGPAVRASGWATHPNVWGMGAVAAAAVAVIVLGPRLITFVPIGLASLVVIASGSRTALIAYGVLAAAVTWTTWSAGRRGVRSRPRSSTLLVAAGLFAFAGVTAVGWWVLGGRDALARFTLRDTASANLLLASEEVGPPYWTTRTATVTHGRGADGWATVEVRATATDGLARVHQRVDLPAGAVRTFSVDIAGAADPGVTAFSEPAGRLTVAADGEVRGVTGPIEVVSTRTDPVSAGRRLHVTVRNASDATVVWRVGLVPTLTGTRDAVATFGRPALVVGDEARAYEPTTVADRVRSLAALSREQRAGYVAAAVAVTRAAPWWGHGSEARFDELADRYAPGVLGTTDRPVHTHMLWTDLLVTRGVLGTVGFLLAVAGFVGLASSAARRRLAPLVLVLVVANTFDLTFWTPVGATLAVIAWLWAVRTGLPATGSHPPVRA